MIKLHITITTEKDEDGRHKSFHHNYGGTAVIMDALEDSTLLFEAEKRMAKAHNTYIPEAEVLSRLGISKADFDDVEVEIE